MSVSRFEDLRAWQAARTLTQRVYQLTRASGIDRDYAFVHQIRRASISVMSNIAEGFERARPKEFHQFLSVAKASCGEVHSLLYAALDAGYCDPESFDEHMHAAFETSRLTNALRASVERRLSASRKRGSDVRAGVPKHSAQSTQHISESSRA